MGEWHDLFIRNESLGFTIHFEKLSPVFMLRIIESLRAYIILMHANAQQMFAQSYVSTHSYNLYFTL